MGRQRFRQAQHGVTANRKAQAAVQAVAREARRHARRLEDERKHAHRRDRQRRARRARWVRIGLAAALIGTFVLWRIHDATTSPIAGAHVYWVLARTHTADPVSYAQSPPVGGSHSPDIQTCGIYATPVRNETAVHALEHGAVWITYQPSIGTASFGGLRRLVANHGYTLLSPYPGQVSEVMATAWGIPLAVRDASDPRLAKFLAFYEQGPQTLERNSPCSGVGQPVAVTGRLS